MALKYKQVVTSFIRSHEKILLLQRSSRVGTHQGRWAGVSGYLEGTENPQQRAITEIQEETGLTTEEITLVRSGEPLRAYDEENSVVWIVHPYLFEADNPTVRVDWEHVTTKWIEPSSLSEYETVPKLKETFERVRWDLQTAPRPLAGISEHVKDLAQDRVHGASYLGSRAVEIVRDAAKLSDATNPDGLFRDLLHVSFLLRKAQPSMATLRNLVGRVLYRANSRRDESLSCAQFRQIVLDLADAELSIIHNSMVKASKNCLPLLPDSCRVLTHSYSSTVREAFELAISDGRQLEVYASESQPGGEGKRLVQDLVSEGIQAQLIQDLGEASELPSVDLVLVGADSIMTNGSVVNKVGTKKIGALANANSTPFYVVCETAKFSTVNFLGENLEIPKALFDLTPSESVTRIVTELGSIEPNRVEVEIRRMLSELYT